jgi:hypothetical protein
MIFKSLKHHLIGIRETITKQHKFLLQNLFLFYCCFFFSFSLSVSVLRICLWAYTTCFIVNIMLTIYTCVCSLITCYTSKSIQARLILLRIDAAGEKGVQSPLCHRWRYFNYLGFNTNMYICQIIVDFTTKLAAPGFRIINFS